MPSVGRRRRRYFVKDKSLDRSAIWFESWMKTWFWMINGGWCTTCSENYNHFRRRNYDNSIWLKSFMNKIHNHDVQHIFGSANGNGSNGRVTQPFDTAHTFAIATNSWPNLRSAWTSMEQQLSADLIINRTTMRSPVTRPKVNRKPFCGCFSVLFSSVKNTNKRLNAKKKKQKKPAKSEFWYVIVKESSTEKCATE